VVDEGVESPPHLVPFGAILPVMNGFRFSLPSRTSVIKASLATA
jgi:hypothetical protein